MSDDAPFEPPDWLDREDEVLAPYAMHTRQSRGRRHPEEPHPFRTLYQRDRDRIVHSTAFRRLMHKTQVLVTQTNDHHRTRLTHTLEVAQISRTIARRLGLNEDLTEAIALSHDLGHPPFGHAGETLSRRVHGRARRLRAQPATPCASSTVLEYRYADFPGLNLSWEVLEAMALHSKRRDAPEVAEFAAVGQPLLEAQVADAADSLAYDAHDIDDALSVGLITPDDLREVEFWRRVRRAGAAPSRRAGRRAIPADRGPSSDRLAGARPAGAHVGSVCGKNASAASRTCAAPPDRWSAPARKCGGSRRELEDVPASPRLQPLPRAAHGRQRRPHRCASSSTSSARRRGCCRSATAAASAAIVPSGPSAITSPA